MPLSRLMSRQGATVLTAGLFACGRSATEPRLTQPVPEELTRLYAEQSEGPWHLALDPVVGGVGQPTDIVAVPGHADTVVVVSKWGMIHQVELRTGLRRDWLWVDSATDRECGVLGIAFAPDFPNSGRFWVNHAQRRDEQLATVVREYWTEPGALAAPRPVADVLVVAQPSGIHAGGQIAFGPDGHLYVSVGDGGPEHRATAQDLSSLSGSLLRLDVSEPGRAVPPSDNPFVGQRGARPEIWAYGLRNPWRFSFGAHGEVLLGDVGDATWEEIDHVHAGDNLGWPHFEGHACAMPPCDRESMVPPIYVYGRKVGASVTGGVVATRGPLVDRFVFADFGTGMLGSLAPPADGEPATDVVLHGPFDIMPSAFGRAPDGNVLVADFGREALYRIVDPGD